MFFFFAAGVVGRVKKKRTTILMGCLWSRYHNRRRQQGLEARKEDGGVSASGVAALVVADSLVRTYPIVVDDQAQVWVGNLPAALRAHPRVRVERDYRGPFPPFVERWSVVDVDVDASAILFVDAVPPPATLVVHTQRTGRVGAVVVADPVCVGVVPLGFLAALGRVGDMEAEHGETGFFLPVDGRRRRTTVVVTVAEGGPYRPLLARVATGPLGGAGGARGREWIDMALLLPPPSLPIHLAPQPWWELLRTQYQYHYHPKHSSRTLSPGFFGAQGPKGPKNRSGRRPLDRGRELAAARPPVSHLPPPLRGPRG